MFILYIFHRQIQSFHTIEELIHLVKRNFPVHDNQVMPADLNNDYKRASDDGDDGDDGDLICILWLFWEPSEMCDSMID